MRRTNTLSLFVLFASEDLGKGTVRITVNPLNGVLVRTVDEHTDQQMERMLANADKTFREIWSKKQVRDRGKIVGIRPTLRC